MDTHDEMAAEMAGLHARSNGALSWLRMGDGELRGLSVMILRHKLMAHALGKREKERERKKA